MARVTKALIVTKYNQYEQKKEKMKKEKSDSK